MTTTEITTGTKITLKSGKPGIVIRDEPYQSGKGGVEWITTYCSVRNGKPFGPSRTARIAEITVGWPEGFEG